VVLDRIDNEADVLYTAISLFTSFAYQNNIFSLCLSPPYMLFLFFLGNLDFSKG
jgi:hypothetical protein